MMRKSTEHLFTFVCALALMTGVNAKDQGVNQTEKEFQQLMPITGTVETFFGNFELDHSFPAEGEADRIYDILDHQRASHARPHPAVT